MTEARSRRKPQLGTIRPLELRDREAVRDICRKTAFRNMGSNRFFEDREVHADYWTRYYTDFRPWESWVVEQDGEVIGYFFGCSDQAHFIRTMTLRILPHVCGGFYGDGQRASTNAPKPAAISATCC